ncbi:restriction endonuclease subunit S [Vibrio diabolicus]|uniref:restriction endonuclease subunit S n=1 Tax=Vibrio diabolicus TaxID=50719 RepID=UPI0013E018AC|nr:restriction endonuclease subunit S [Vibrio diabolicus]QOV30491.1 restriction endonuclease subunit S [Vibrio diabolicus]
MTLTQWKSKSLGYILEKIVGGGTPSKANLQYWDGDIPWASVKDLSSTKLDDTADKISEEGLKNSASNLIPAETIVIPTRMALGKVALTTQAMAINQDLKALFPSKEVCKSYLFQWLIFHAEQIASLGTGSTVKGIRLEQLKKIPFSYPTLKEEQKKIADILSTVDKKIDLIDQKIAETEKLKTGLMQKLFSEGVGVQDENGNWQPHTEFQDSPFGKIPKCWSVETLGEHTIKVGSGVTPKGGSKAYVDTGIPLIRSQNVLFGKFKLDDVAFITEQQHEKMKGSQLQPRDVLLNITGASIGRCAVLPADFEEGNVNQHVCIIRMSQAITPEFCGCFLNSNLGQKQIWNLQAGGNREGLNFQQIRSFRIPVLTAEEQCSIVEILSTVGDKLNLLEQQKVETQQLKKGLMQKLLTGEWRVPVEETEAA